MPCYGVLCGAVRCYGLVLRPARGRLFRRFVSLALWCSLDRWA